MDNSINDELALTIESKELAMYKSMYYAMNAKPDSISKAYASRIIVCKDDIIELNERIREKILMNYEDDGYVATVTVNLKDRHTITFKNWEEFLQHKWTESSCINSLLLQWNFNLRIPGYNMPQNHNLVVKLTNGLRPEEMLNLIFAGKMEDMNEIEVDTFPVVARVDFIQALLAEELLNIVGNWVEGLSRSNDLKNSIILMMRKYRKLVAQCFEYISLIMVYVLFVCVVSGYLHNLNVDTIWNITINDVNILFIIIIVGCLIIHLVKEFLNVEAHKIYEKLWEYGRVYIFNITKGDQRQQNEIENKDKINGKHILLKLILSLIFNVLCGILSSILI